MNGFINVHCHIINFHFTPDAFFRTRAPIREWLLRRRLTHRLARLITSVIPGKKYDKLHECLEIYKKDIYEVAETLLKEMEEANIKLAIPLMMDLEIASFEKKPEVPYRHQIELTSRIASQFPGVFIPFVMVDPRRENAAAITIEALEELGFLGVKMYPPLGYHPYHESFFNDPEVNHELREVYEYCNTNTIPITIHCSPGGAYSGEVMKYPELRKELTKPSNWRKVLAEFPNLYLNLAHFGGDLLDIDDAQSWSYEIEKMIEEYENVYTDLAYHDEALEEETQEMYFQILNKLLDENSKAREKTLFGTDWSMTRHTWDEKDYITPFTNNLNSLKMKQIAVSNPMNFLFPERKIPERILKFMKKYNKKIPDYLNSYFDSGSNQ